MVGFSTRVARLRNARQTLQDLHLYSVVINIYMYLSGFVSMTVNHRPINIEKLLRDARKAREASEQFAKQAERDLGKQTSGKKSFLKLFSRKEKKWFSKKIKLRTEPKTIERKPSKGPSKTFPIIATIIIALIASGLIWLVSNRATDCGTDSACFTQLANQCGNAKMSVAIAGAEFSMHTTNCELTKKLYKLSETEPETVRQALEGKQMICAFEQGAFEQDYLTTITAHSSTCTGDLKTALEFIKIG